MSAHIESGMQLLARLSKSCKTSLQGLDNNLFPEGLQAKQTIEISGNPGCGKTLLLTQLIASCILPSEYNQVSINGFNMNVLFINTDHHFRVSKLSEMMRNIIKNSFKNQEKLSEANLKQIIEISLKNLLIINCSDYNQFLCTLYSLPDIFNSNSKIGLVALDGISAFYWQDRELGNANSLTINSYLSYILTLIQESAFQFNVKTIFTKHVEFVSKGKSVSECVSKPTLGEVNHRINLLKEIDSSVGLCKVETTDCQRSFEYETSEEAIKWLEAKH